MDYRVWFRKVYLVTLNIILIGAILFAYTSGVNAAETQMEQTALLIGTTIVLAVYVFIAVLADRIGRQIQEITENVDSIADSVDEMT